MKMDKQDEKLLDYCLNEIKDQYKIFLEGFDDIKNKNQILLVICSLIITLPLSNDSMVNKIMLSIYSSGIFIAGLICLIISILLLILSMSDTPVNIPYFNDIFNSVGKYKSSNVKRAIIKTYSEDLEANIRKIESKLKYVRFAEKLIISGLLLVIGVLLWVMII